MNLEVDDPVSQDVFSRPVATEEVRASQADTVVLSQSQEDTQGSQAARTTDVQREFAHFKKYFIFSVDAKDRATAKCAQRTCGNVLKIQLHSVYNLKRHYKSHHPSLVNELLVAIEDGSKRGRHFSGVSGMSTHSQKTQRQSSIEASLKKFSQKKECLSESPFCPDEHRTQPTSPIINDTNSSEAAVITPPKSTRSRPTKRKSNLTQDVLLSVKEHFKRPQIQEDRFDIFGKNVSMKIRDLPNQQRIIAEKLINDALFEAELGTLTTGHRLTAPFNAIQSVSPSFEYNTSIAPPCAQITQNTSVSMCLKTEAEYLE